jgi:hypothetical protein
MMHGAHIGGQRGGEFRELVRGVDPQRVLLVGIDVAKATWFVVASTCRGRSWSMASGWSPTWLGWPSSSA